MSKNVRAALGVLLLLMGLTWTLQGLGILQSSSPMTGVTLWAVVGPIVAVAGALLITSALHPRRPR